MMLTVMMLLIVWTAIGCIFPPKKLETRKQVIIAWTVHLPFMLTGFCVALYLCWRWHKDLDELFN